MKSLIRRPKGSYVLTVRITLYEGADDDLIEKLKKVENGNLAKTIKNMLRSGNKPDEIETEDDEDVDLSGLGMEI